MQRRRRTSRGEPRTDEGAISTDPDLTALYARYRGEPRPETDEGIISTDPDLQALYARYRQNAQFSLYGKAGPSSTSGARWPQVDEVARRRVVQVDEGDCDALGRRRVVQVDEDDCDAEEFDLSPKLLPRRRGTSQEEEEELLDCGTFLPGESSIFPEESRLLPKSRGKVVGRTRGEVTGASHSQDDEDEEPGQDVEFLPGKSYIFPEESIV